MLQNEEEQHLGYIKMHTDIPPLIFSIKALIAHKKQDLLLLVWRQVGNIFVFILHFQGDEAWLLSQ